MNFHFDPADLRHTNDLPAQCDVVVIGGGVIGVTAAIYLRRMGQSVTLLEKGRIAGEQSGRNWGWVRVQGRDPDEIPIMLEARALWAGLDQDTGGETGLRTCGVTYVGRNEKDMRGFEQWLSAASGQGLDSRILNARELATHLPGIADGFAGAIVTPSDMCAEPWQAVPAMARVAAREGVVIAEGCAVRGLDIQGGRVAGVVTEKGKIGSDGVLLAGGAWSALFLRRHGVRLPQLSVRSNVLATSPGAELPETAMAATLWASRPRQDGGYSIAPSGFNELFVGPDAFRALPKYWPVMRKTEEFDYHLKPFAPKGFPDAWGTPRKWDDSEETPFERMRMLNPAPNDKMLDEARRRITRWFPDCRLPADQQRWAGMIDVLPDLVPVVDNVPELPGLTLATGLSGHGFGIGPGFGMVAARLAVGRPPGHDMTRFRMSRFTDGSRMDIGPAL